MIIAFTGHRPHKLGGYNDRTNFKSKFDKLVMKIFTDNFMNEFRNNNLEIITGMALGVDTWAAYFAISCKIPFRAYIPFSGQEKMWPTESQSMYRLLLTKASKIKYICDPGYAAWKMQKRNEAMINDCDILVAIWDGTSGGTGNCVKYAQSIKKQIVRFNPLDYKIKK